MEGLRTQNLRIGCPHSGEEVECRITEVDEVAMAVTECSAFRRGDPITCDKLCLHMLNRGFTLDSDGDG
jgi:hypothetical protein